ncbi:MAG TPA: dTMP kinase [Chlamydiales bacterium]|nr:dTMP kinase [Chlamydiales bacterium]
MFITFEGGEGAGKTTLIKSIAEELHRHHEVLLTREPGGTPLGEEIRNVLLHSSDVHPKAELFLFLAARIQHVEGIIKPALKQKKIVLCDRFSDSTIAYQGGARGLGVEYVVQLTQQAIGNFEPDTTFYIDIDPVAGLARAGKKAAHDRIEKEAIHFHESVRAAFLLLEKNNPHRFHILDGMKPKEALFQEAMEIINERIRK